MKRLCRCFGFTLVEIIVTLVLVAVAATMATTFFNRGITRSELPMTSLQDDAKLQLVMENMIQDFNSNTLSLATLLANACTNKVYATSGTSYTATCNYYSLSGTTFTNVGATATSYMLVTVTSTTNTGVSLSYLFAR